MPGKQSIAIHSMKVHRFPSILSAESNPLLGNCHPKWGWESSTSEDENQAKVSTESSPSEVHSQHVDQNHCPVRIRLGAPWGPESASSEGECQGTVCFASLHRTLLLTGPCVGSSLEPVSGPHCASLWPSIWPDWSSLPVDTVHYWALIWS